MVLNKLFGGQRKPFLEISKAPATPVNVAPVQPVVEVEAEPAMVAAIQLKQPPETQKQEEQKQAAQKESKVLTTAQLLAAERAEEQAKEVVISNVTFAAELLNPASSLPRARRRPGAALADFKAMAGEIRR
ncbi:MULTISPECIES: hypothetical protein [Synechococcus]|jgi:hypothetical protein|uniref:hypothetical protein n=1 Tax=Synechococcus TaxID=1129 RepID=UPI0009C935E1|nr:MULTISPECIES: hypothetical protein [Synechococcus]MCP9922719.1 hypothetical protein [Synechococcus lacustris Cruz CV12-2]OON13114.1 MAG: hypothetical protein BTM30_00815 [Synechococcus lacustris str. Tous]